MTTTKDKAPPETTALVRTTKTSVLMRMAERYQLDPKVLEATLRATAMPNDGKAVSNEEFCAFLMVADEYALNPLTRQIYAFRGKSGGIVPVVGVDGWYATMQRHPQFNGLSFRDEKDEGGEVVAITAIVRRRDWEHPLEITEYMDECVRDTGPWKSHPRRMLRHKAAIQAGRAAFGLTNIYDPDEAERMTIDTTAVVKPLRGGMKALEERITRAPEPEDALDQRPVEPEPDAPAPEGALFNDGIQLPATGRTVPS